MTQSSRWHPPLELIGIVEKLESMWGRISLYLLKGGLLSAWLATGPSGMSQISRDRIKGWFRAVKSIECYIIICNKAAQMLSLKHRLLVLKNIYEPKPIDLVLVSRKLLDLSIEKFHDIFIKYLYSLLSLLFVFRQNQIVIPQLWTIVSKNPTIYLLSCLIAVETYYSGWKPSSSLSRRHFSLISG